MRPGSKTLAALWGLAEATVFFIVPDVVLTCLALSSLKKALWASLAAALAAVLGGVLVWVCAAGFPEATFAFLLRVPGISNATFATVRDLLAQGLFPGMLQGAFTGVPYKIFAAEAGATGSNPVLFAVVSPLVRFPRFAIMSLIAFGLSRLVGTRLSSRRKTMVCLTLWAVFYVAYFRVVGW